MNIIAIKSEMNVNLTAINSVLGLNNFNSSDLTDEMKEIIFVYVLEVCCIQYEGIIVISWIVQPI